MDTVSTAICSNINELMKKYDVANVELAKAISVSPSTVGKWLNNKSTPRPDAIKKIADYFSVDTDVITRTSRTAADAEAEACTDADVVQSVRNTVLTSEEKKILNAFSELNAKGKNEAIKRVLELSNIKDYSNNENTI